MRKLILLLLLMKFLSAMTFSFVYTPVFLYVTFYTKHLTRFLYFQKIQNASLTMCTLHSICVYFYMYHVWLWLFVCVYVCLSWFPYAACFTPLCWLFDEVWNMEISSVIPLWSTNGYPGGLLLQFAQGKRNRTLTHTDTHVHTCSFYLSTQILNWHDPPAHILKHKQTYCHP